jgi:membrane dipeptidase
MKLSTICLAAVLLLLAGPSFSQDDPHMAKVLRVLSNTPLIDGHNDLPWAIRESVTSPHDVHAPEHNLRQRTAFHTDIPRLQEGMIGGQFWSVYIPYSPVNSGAAQAQLEQIDIANQIIARYPDVFAAAYTASDVNRIFGEGRIASMLGIEGGHAIENSLGVLRAYYAMGVRYMTLTHNGTLDWADAANGDQVHGGLTEFGNEVVREMNRLGMMVDLSHTSVGTMSDALDVSVAPVIWSHADTKALNDVGRNVPDEILRRLPDNGGVVMITFVGSFLTSNDEATIVDVANHIEHVVEVAGIDHVGIGSDYDGTDSLPVGMEDVSTYPKLFLELSIRGWSENDMAKLAGENILRAMSETEVVARRLQRERGPSMATIEELDGN